MYYKHVTRVIANIYKSRKVDFINLIDSQKKTAFATGIF